MKKNMLMVYCKTSLISLRSYNFFQINSVFFAKLCFNCDLKRKKTFIVIVLNFSIFNLRREDTF